MGNLLENIPLQSLNTFHIGVFARYYVELSNPEEIQDFFTSDLSKVQSRLILGGGSNILFTGNFEGIVIRPALKGIEKTRETKDYVFIKAGAGENWDDFVNYSVQHNYGGIENLSLIPGWVGASPIQNIGAYGVEVKDAIEEVTAYDIASNSNIYISASDCHFGYRNSIFKQELKNLVVITHVTFKLTKNHEFKTHYADLERELDNYAETTIQNIRKAVITIRKKKLPDPDEIGNAGSFFKNPVVSIEQARSIKQFYPNIPEYPCDKENVKLSAAWLIDQCGWKGKRVKNAGTHKKQPLVIVNYGGASGSEILKLAKRIQHAVMKNFGVKLETEVNVV